MSTALMAPGRNKRNEAGRATAQAVVEQYQPKNVQEMQDAVKDIFGPMFEAMLQGEMDSRLGKEVWKMYILEYKGEDKRSLLGKITANQLYKIPLSFDIMYSKITDLEKKNTEAIYCSKGGMIYLYNSCT